MIYFDLDGDMVPPGQTELVDVVNFASTSTLPGWLTAKTTAGTIYEGATNTFNTQEGFYQGTTVVSSASRAAGLETLPFDLSKCEAYKITFRDIRFEGTPSGYSIGITDNMVTQLRGIRYSHTSGDSFVNRRYGTGSTVSAAVTSYNWQATQRRDLSILVFPRTKRYYFFENDQIVHAAVAPTMSLTVLTGHLFALKDAADNTSASFKVAAVERRIWLGGVAGTPIA